MYALSLELSYNLSFELGYFWHTLGENINKKLQNIRSQLELSWAKRDMWFT